jgi:hypothetical protein
VVGRVRRLILVGHTRSGYDARVNRATGHWLLLLLAVPVLLLVVTLRISLGAGEATASAPRGDAIRFDGVCEFPGTPRRRLVVAAVDSLRAETAFDEKIMPWLSSHRREALWGRMQPCMSQLSLLCFRTMFEGAEPLMVTGFHNYTGMNVAADNFILRLSQRGVRVAAVADHAFVSLYQTSLAAHATFEERPAGSPSRDAFGREQTLKWLSDPSLAVIVTHVIDTDATAHRVGIGHAEYVAKFRETDDFLRTISERLGESDSLIVLGDHGHDAHGYHSTGIPSQTAYFASGPAFPRGVRRDTGMATTLFLMGAVSCEPVPDTYRGEFPVAELSIPPEYRAVQQRVAARLAPLQATQARSSPVTWELPAVLALFFVIVAALSAHTGVLAAKPAATASLLLVPGLVFPSAVVPWLGALGLGVAGRRAVRALWRYAALLAVAFAVAFGVGLSAHETLVTLQNHVNARWTVGLWLGLAAVIAGIGLGLSKRAGMKPRHALGVAAASVLLLLLGFGPYYYGTARNLLYGTTWLIFSHALEVAIGERRVRGLLALTVLPLVALYAPVLKEWQWTYPLLGWFEHAGTAARLGVSFAAFAVASLAARDGKERVRFAVLLGLLTAMGFATDLAPLPFLNVTCLWLSYVGFSRAAERVEARVLSPSAAWVLPLGQAAYGFMAFFVLLGALRFANVDFRFALSLTPIEAGEARAAAVAVPIVTAKYLVPIALLFLSGPALRVEALLLVLVKVGCLSSGLLGFELARRSEAQLFLELQTQEAALVAVLYMLMLGLFALRRQAGVA